MALPTKVKTWEYNVGVDCTEVSYLDSARHAIHQIKVALASFSSWSVVASSDSVSVKNIGDASPDLWAAWSNVVAGAGAHSWVILENSVTGGQLCIDLDTANSYRVTWLYSASGSFGTDGTTSLRPSNTESVSIQPNSASWMGTTSLGAVVNVWCSSDGKCTRVDVHQKEGVGDFGDFFFAIEDLANPASLWSGTIHQAVMVFDAGMVYSTTPASQHPVVTNYDNTTQRGKVYQTDVTPYEGWNEAFYTQELYHQWYSGAGDGISSLSANNLEWAGGYAVSSIGLFRDINPRGGGQGQFQDIYWAHKLHPTYSTYPSGGAKSWIKIGCFFLPWNGSTPVDVP